MEILFADKRFHDFVISANTNDQLFDAGIDSKGVTLGEYAPSTKKHKKRVGLPSNRVTLFETGYFHKSWKLFLDENKDVIISADDNYPYGYLFDKYGEDILGLTPENLEGLRNLSKIILQEALLNNIRKAA